MKQKAFNITLAAVALCSVAVIALTAVPIVYTVSDSYWDEPVVVNMQAVDWQRDERGYWVARVYGVKLDESCDFQLGKTVANIYRLSSNRPAFESPVDFPDDKTPGNSRPAGYLDFGLWRILEPEITKGTTVRLSVEHICPNRDPKKVTTHFQPWVVGVDTESGPAG